ncbi:MAG: hypothetical protein HUK40_14570 [Desulfobacter sp.]|nr:hypothetical protein [Desulfobacter sp.]MDD9303487.1 hypothetical protein [Desulfobacter sp.]WDP84167.1 MAG: hypothetical protein HUN05_02495 [Desulfobacter sp.]
MNLSSHLLGDLLVSMEMISRDQLDQALALQASRSAQLGRMDRRKMAMALEVGFIINSTLDLGDGFCCKKYFQDKEIVQA